MTEHESFIHNLQIATPCKADWNEMSGDERKRFCGACKLHVYNISAMTLPEAEALIAGADGGRVCVRMFRRADGTVMTQDCPVGLAAKLKSRVKKTVAYVSAAAALAIAWVVNTRQEGPITTHPVGGSELKATMGESMPQNPVQGQMMTGDVQCFPANKPSAQREFGRLRVGRNSKQ